MKQSEIMFVEMWREFSLDGALTSDDANKASLACPGRLDSILGGPADPDVPGLIETCTRPDGWDWHITPRGADLVASYEAALVLGLDIVADEAYPPPDPWSPDLVDCPDCDDGTIGIPVAYAENGGILRVWPATCQRCEGSGQVEGLADVGTSIAGVAETLDDITARFVEATGVPAHIIDPGEWVLLGDLSRDQRIALVGKRIQTMSPAGNLVHDFIVSRIEGPGHDVRSPTICLSFDDWRIRVVKPARDRDLEWRQLTRVVADGLVGKTFEVRRNKKTAIHVSVNVSHLMLDGRWWVREVA